MYKKEQGGSGWRVDVPMRIVLAPPLAQCAALRASMLLTTWKGAREAGTRGGVDGAAVYVRVCVCAVSSRMPCRCSGPWT